MATDYELSFRDYLAIMRRRAPYLIGIFVAVLLIAVIVAITIPSTYRATGTIMVESQQIPDSIVPTAVKNQLEERLNIIKQRVMTRENLVQIANKYDLFKTKLDPQTPSELIDRIRDRIVVETSTSKDALRTSRQDQAIAFTLSFDARNPEVALNVTNDLITLFLEWNVRLRTGVATETTAFLTQESDKLKSEVYRLDKLITAYKLQYGNTLPEQLTLRMSMLSRAENDMREVERDIRSTKENIRALELEFSAARRGLGDDSTPQTLPALKTEFVRLSTIYNESHPDVRRVKRKIEIMERTAELPASNITSTEISGNSLSPAMYRIQSKIDSDKSRLSSLELQRKMLHDKITENEDAMTRPPKVELGLDVLTRDRDNAQKKYEEIVNKLMNAKIAESLESGNKTGRFSVLEAPLLPEKPYKPDRIKILILGLVLAIASSVGTMITLESIDKRIRGIEAITHILGYRPLVVIPFIPLQEDEVRRKHILNVAITSAIAAMIIFAMTLHFL